SELRKEIERRIRDPARQSQADDVANARTTDNALPRERAAVSGSQPQTSPATPEPTPNPSQERNGRGAHERLLPSWEGSGVGSFKERAVPAVADWLSAETGLGESGASQLADYFCAAYQALGVI